MSWSLDGYDAGIIILFFLHKKKTVNSRVQKSQITFSPDLNVTRYRLPWQCQDFLSGQETGGDRK